MTRIPLDPAFLGAPVAHRGYHDGLAGRPENSRAAIRAAVAAGYGIEIDLQISGDGVAMVFHDDTLDRMTAGRGPVSAHPAAELSPLALKGGDGGETIPTFREILDIVAGRVALLVEIKDMGGRMGPEGVGPLEEAAARDAAGYAGPLAFMSFNPASVAAMRSFAPDVARGLTATTVADMPALPHASLLAEMGSYESLDASFCSYRADALPTARTAALRERGDPVLCWTIRSAEAEAAARRFSDNVTFEGYAAVSPG